MPIDINKSVIDRVSSMDPDRVRAARLAEPVLRDQLFTLYAFHAELAKVPELVSEPMMGQIRYQWWRDCLEEIYSGCPVRAHEVSQPLAAMINETGISRFYLDKLIDGRERDLDPRPFETVSEAIDYADATSGTLMKAALSLTGQDGGLLAGRAWGLTGLCRSYRYYSDTILKGVRFADLMDAARHAFNAAKDESYKNGLPAMAYVRLVPGFLKRMARQDYDPLTDVPEYSPFLKQVTLLSAVIKGGL
jgi:phytoene synthase